MRHLVLAVATGLLALAGCTELDPLLRGSCGNGIIEPEFGEDCDGPTDPLCGAATDPVQACRRLCDFASTDLCAPGAACGADGICHLASGAFTAVSERAWSATDTLVLDGNGDGAPDLVGVSSQRVDLALGVGDGTFAATTSLPGQYVTGAPAVGDPTGDGLPDVLIPTPIGVLTLAGDSVDGLTPVTQNSIPVETSGRIVFGAGPVGDFGALVQAVQGPTGGALMIERPAPLGSQFLALPGARGVDEILDTELTVVPLAGESVLVVPFATGVWMVGLRVVDNGGEPAVAMTSYGLVTLVPGSGEVRRAFAADVNADDHPDVVIVTGGGRIQVVRGAPISILQPFRGFASGTASVLWTPVTADELAIDPLVLRDAVAVPIETAPNVFETGHVTVVAARRSLQFLVCLADGTPPCEMHELRRGVRDWTHARVLDVNADGLVDFVGYAVGEANVDVLLASEAGLGLFVYNDAALATPRPMRALETGQFDGDGVIDLVLAVGSDPPDTVATDHEVHVAFGTRDAAPAPPVLAAKLGSVVALIGFNAPLAFRFDALDDVLVVSDRGPPGGPTTRGAAVLLGSTSRLLVAPLLLSDDEDFLTPVALAPMYLDPRAGEDLVVIGRTSAGFTVLPYSPNGFTMELLGTIELPLAQAVRPDRALWTTVARTGPVRIGAAADDLGRVVAFEFPCDPCGQTLPRIVPLDAGRPLPGATALRAGDVDGDGDDDLIGVFTGRTQSVVVLWTHDDGMTPQAAHVLTFDGEVHDAVAADLDLDGAPALVLAGGAGVLAVARDGATWQSPVVLHPRPDGALPFVFVDVADFTADGLADLVVATGADRLHPVTLQVLGQVENRSAFVEVSP